MKPVIVIAGPTASGKSSLGISLAKSINGYVVNGDSRQVYRGYPISTAQPQPEIILADGTWIVEGIPHYMYGITDIGSDYNVYRYKQDITDVINLHQVNYPILVGGTGLYIDSYIYDYNLEANQISEYSRKELNSYTTDELKDILGNRLDNLNESDRENKVRIIREIEKMGEVSTRGEEVKSIYIYLDLPMEKLEENIRERIEMMFEQGLENEARTFSSKYDSPKIIGIDEFKPYFNNEITIEEVKQNIFTHTRQYAKRQKTWFKRNRDAIVVDNLDNAMDEVKSRLDRMI